MGVGDPPTGDGVGGCGKDGGGEVVKAVAGSGEWERSKIP